MYASFLRETCKAEEQLNMQYSIDNKSLLEKHYSCQPARLQVPMYYLKNNECDVVKKHGRFCNDALHICNEQLQTKRSQNGNDQKMWLFSTKNKDYKPHNAFYWVEPDNKWLSKNNGVIKPLKNWCDSVKLPNNIQDDWPNGKPSQCVASNQYFCRKQTLT